MHQDYIMRMIQQLSGFLVRVVLLRKAGKADEAVAEIREAYGRLGGVNGSLVHALSEEDLVQLLRARGAFDADRCLALAELLREEGHAYDDLGRLDEAVPRYLKALRLYLEVSPDLEEIPAGYKPEVLDELLDRLEPAVIPTATFDRLLEHFEEIGRYDEAENALLHRIEAFEEDPAIVDRGLMFYRRLVLRSDDALEGGGLPREEVQEGIARLVELQASPGR